MYGKLGLRNLDFWLQTDLIHRLSGGAQSGRAAAAEKALEKMKTEGTLIERPFVPKKRSFAFPNVETMGQQVRILGQNPCFLEDI